MLLTIDEHGTKSIETVFLNAICRQFGLRQMAIKNSVSSTLLTIDENGSKSIETVIRLSFVAIFGDKWQSKTLFLAIFDL